MIVQNLLDIIQKNRTTECPTIKEKQIKPSNVVAAAERNSDPDIDNFCFLRPDKELRDLKNAFTSFLDKIESHYGSTTLVARYYDRLIKDQEFIRNRYDNYPPEIFKAIRRLEFLGGGEPEGYRSTSEDRKSKLDAAFFLGYYFMF